MNVKTTIVLFLALITTALPTFADSNPGVLCAEKQYIAAIDFGYVTNIQGGSDWANAINVHLDNGVIIPLNYKYNANDDGGKSIIAALRMALSTNKVVSMWDHDSNNCDDFDQVRVYASLL
ncbi:hypothetical protein HWQ46_14235 [Shewanella sp. D64]|uniref:hypothetical protein n=1 Tax=unclassified Shewanella TaxID=196818 RepID=UPI0022BA496B|nr:MULTISPECIES: hypothetical protein [unclassified Shewanella]MEC4726708.1 hypothetical protein [Shewanella sp. D64]MEC4738928.1 hypothetical protein [Shewanella sp. E94]WBJ96919.1 hypothetical protein HWQ47_07340 [Shewanella sp. MTB7]